MKIKGSLTDLGKRIHREIDGALEESADAILDRARANGRNETGDYDASLHTEKVGDLRYQVYSDSDHARFLEYGTENMPPQAPLRTACDAEETSILKRIKKGIARA